MKLYEFEKCNEGDIVIPLHGPNKGREFEIVYKIEDEGWALLKTLDGRPILDNVGRPKTKQTHIFRQYIQLERFW